MKPLIFDENDLKKILQPETAWTSFSRRWQRVVRNLIALISLFIVFSLALNASALGKRLSFQLDPPTAQVQPPPEKTEPATPVVNYPPTIEIPKLAVYAPIITGIALEELLNQLQNGVVHYPGSALPGQIGNAVLVGHSSDFPWNKGQYKTVFALLDKLSPGDTILVPFQQRRHLYEVKSIEIVKPTDLAVLNPTDDPTLTLISCYPVGTTLNRIIVTAKLVSPTATDRQTSQPTLTILPKVR